MSTLYEFAPCELRLHPIRTHSAWEWQIALELQDDGSGNIEPVNVAAAEARLQMRRKASDVTPVFSLTHTAGLTLLENTVGVRLTSQQTAALAPIPCELVWDLQLRLPSGDWWTPLKGTVPVEQGRSR